MDIINSSCGCSSPALYPVPAGSIVEKSVNSAKKFWLFPAADFLFSVTFLVNDLPSFIPLQINQSQKTHAYKNSSFFRTYKMHGRNKIINEEG
ncbi:MAG: hypothetical protein MR704_15360 [Clostridia bacterium]|nr:hypothetical protein [Clostridia bacterium]